MLIRSESQSVSGEILGQNEIMEMRNKSGGDRPPPFFFYGCLTPGELEEQRVKKDAKRIRLVLVGEK